MKIISLLRIAPLGLAACAPAHVTGAVEVGTPVYAGSPVLAAVAPGVEVGNSVASTRPWI